MKFYIIIVISFFLLGGLSCSSKQSVLKQTVQTTKQKSDDPICGDSVVWHVHLQRQFKNDTITFIFEGDTLEELIVNSGNDCSSIHLSFQRKYEENNLYLFTPNFSSSKKLRPDIQTDSIKLDLIINGTKAEFRERLKYFKHFGINAGFDYDRSEKCLICI